MSKRANTHTIDEEHNDVQKARIEQLLTYMADCQQGIRDLNSQIQTVLTVISTLLTLVFGYSVINALSEDSDVGYLLNLPTDAGPLNGRYYRILNAMITIRRINFWLTSAIILIGVLFITCLEIEKILRYQYSQHLADRLHDLIPGTLDDRVRNALVTYQQFASPIKTNNLFHVSNSHNLFNFTAVYATGIIAGCICLGVVIVQFILIKDYHWYDWFTLWFVLFVIILDGILLVRFVWYTDEACDMAFYMANQNLEVRKGLSTEEKLYWWAAPFLEFLSYLLYPRKESLFKALLTVGGFLVACIVGGKFYISHLVYILIVFELLLYQARYQFNDLRGLDEDKRYTQKRLVNYVDEAKPVRVIATLGFAIIRLVMAFVLVYYLGGSIKTDLYWCVLTLFVVTIVYEAARRSPDGRWIILLSGAGFPIRVLVGVLAADRDVVLLFWPYYNHIVFITILLLLLLWGTCTSLLSWVRDIERLERSGIHDSGDQFPKAHYNIIYPCIKDRLAKVKERGNDDSIAGEKCNIKDPWCMVYWTMIFLLVCCWFWYVWSMDGRLWALSFGEMLALLAASFVIVADYDEMIASTKYCVLFVFVTLYISFITKHDMRIIIAYNVLLVSVVFSVCILRNRKRVIRIPNLFKYLAVLLIGEKAVQMLKRPMDR